MGYILPITPYQSMQYANIQQAGYSGSYAQIDEVQRARMKTRFEKELDKYMERANVEENIADRMDRLPLPRPDMIVIHHPPFKSVAEITGKGAVVNAYV